MKTWLQSREDQGGSKSAQAEASGASGIKTFHSPRKEEEQRRQLEAEFIQTFAKRHHLKQKLVAVESQILDLEQQGYSSFGFLEDIRGVAGGGGGSGGDGSTKGAEGAGASVEAPAQKREASFLFSVSSTSSPLHFPPKLAVAHHPQQVPSSSK